MALQHLRSSTANKRPIPTVMSSGQIAINTNEASPGLFFKDSNGDLVKVGPVHIGTDAPNSSPASTAATALVAGTTYQILTVGDTDFTLVGASSNTVGVIFTATGAGTGTGTVSGQQGVEKGEQWLDTTGGTYVLKIWDGTAWRSESGTFVDVNGDTMTGALLLDNAASVSAPDLSFDGDANTGIYSPGADQVAIATAGTAAVTVDASQNVGIGTSSPGSKLHVDHDINAEAYTIIENSRDYGFGVGIDFKQPFVNAGSSIVGGRIRSDYESDNNSFFAFSTLQSGTLGEKLRIDSSGNVGINTSSPSSYYADKLVVNAGAENGITIIGDSGNRSYLAFADGTSGNAAYRGYIGYQHSNDSLELAAGAAVHVTVGATGNVGIGTTAPSANLESQGDVSSTTQFSGFQGLRIQNANGAAFGVSADISFVAGTGTDNRGAVIGAVYESGAGGNDLYFATNSSAVTSSDTPTEKMRITAAGATKMTTTNDYFSSNALIYEMRNSNPNNWIAYFTNNNAASPFGLSVRYPSASPNSTGSDFYHAEDSTATRFRVRSNGGVENFSSNNANLCDEREKKNIVSLDAKWDTVKDWELKKFHYNEDADTDDLRYGVIAQQVETVCPEVLTEWEKQSAAEAELDEDGNVVTPAREQIMRKGVKEQQMMWMAIKALQEAQERIETLEAKVAALEAG